MATYSTTSAFTDLVGSMVVTNVSAVLHKIRGGYLRNVPQASEGASP